MFKRRTKALQAADSGLPPVPDKNGSAVAGADNNNGYVIRPATATSTIGVTSRYDKPESQQPTSIVDDECDDPDADESLSGLQRMKRNLTVSRSGRYKSKSRPRPAVSALQTPTASQSVATSSSQSTSSGPSYVPSVMATGGGGVMTSGYGALSGVSTSGSISVGAVTSSQYRGQQTAPRGISTAL